MKCSNCQKENDPESSYCIFCGSPLHKPEPDVPVAPVSGTEGTPVPQVQQLQAEIRSLRELVRRISDRLVVLERRQGIEVPPPELIVHPPEPEPVLPTKSIIEPVPETELVSTVAAVPGPETVPDAAVPVSTPIQPTPSVRKDKGVPAKPREWEQILGGNWLARIGVIALIIGAAFFIKFAFDNDWLGPTARVILGAVVGLAMVGGGYYWQKKYPVFAQALSGGGIAILYLSVFAAFNIFQLIPFYPAVGLLLLISIGSAALSVRLNSMALAIIGIFGAFSAPFILGIDRPIAGDIQAGQSVQLLIYIMVVDLGVLLLSTFRNWRWFTLLALFSSLTAYGLWHSELGYRASLLIQQSSLTVIFLIFVGATSLFHIIWRRPVKGADYTLMAINAAAYFGISYGIMWDELRAWMGGFTLLLALFYGGLAYMALKRGAENIRLSHFALGIALVLLTIAVPVQLGDKAWVTIAWAAEGTILAWLYLRHRITYLRIFSYLVFASVAIRLMFFDTAVDMRQFQPVFNERFLAFVVSIAAMYLVAYLYWRYREDVTKPGYPAFIIVANIFSIWIIAAEVIGYRDIPETLAGSLSLIVLVALAGATTLYHIVWQRAPRVFDMVMMVVSAAAYFGISSALWEPLRGWMGSLYFVLALFFGVLAYITLRRRAENTVFGFLALGIALVFFTVAIPVQLGNVIWTTIAWAAEGLALMWLSLFTRLPHFRYYSYAVFALMAGRLLIFDTRIDLQTFQPVFNERFLAFVIGIGALYLCAYLVWRKRESIAGWRGPLSVFLAAANFFSLWLLSFEVWNYFGSQLQMLKPGEATDSLRNDQNLSLTALWAIYAAIGLIIGIAKRWRPVRLAALALLAV
ncbi:MAG TPA: DUF2339 domain-containing protein, partial [Dehalococcoidia bacterium]|nr:DUF2339 domain-containing protein [Dehalococcoidia bacterium]